MTLIDTRHRRGFARLDVRVDERLARGIEAVRGDTPVAVYVRRLIREDVVDKLGELPVATERSAPEKRRR